MKQPVNHTKAANAHYVSTIVVEGAVARIDGTFLLGPVQDVTSFYTPGYQFTQKYKMGFWDGRTKLYHKGRKTFPAGLAQDVLEALRAEGCRVTLDDRRNCPGSPDTSQRSLEGVSFDYPYDFQVDCALAMVGGQRGIAAVATNGGKTTIACLVTKMLKLKTLFMVPNLSLLYQTQRVFQNRLGMEVGVIGDGHWQGGNLVTVASINTLWNRIGESKCRNLLKEVRVVFADECHHVGSDTWFKILGICDAYYRFGLSGTPLKRTDGADLKLIGQTGPVLYEIRNKELIERGISVKPHIHFVEINKPQIAKTVPWDEAYKRGIVENPFRNQALCNKVQEFADQGLSVLVLVREVAHGQALDKKMWSYPKGSFLPHQFICGEESTEIREKALVDFREGKIKVLIATSILDEGVDIPNIDVLVLAGGGKSSIATLQRVGRGLRKGGTVDRLYIVDTIDFQQHHLLKHSLQRLEDYKAEECFEIEEISK